MAIPVKNGVKIYLPDEGKVGNADVWKVGNVFMFVINPNYIWREDIAAMGWNVDAEVWIRGEAVFRSATNHGGRWDILLVNEKDIVRYTNAF